MDYTVKEMAALSGVSIRTLRYYDQIGLLCPARAGTGQYRKYSPADVDRLQHILFYRELGFSLHAIGQNLDAPDFDAGETLRAHRQTLLKKQSHLEALLHTLERTLDALEGATTMNDHQKFEGLKDKVIADNEAAYGQEIRSRHGDAAVDSVNAKIKGMTEEAWSRTQALEGEVADALVAAVATQDPKGEAAAVLCRLHKAWLLCHWTPEMYSPQAHCALAEGYLADPRLAAYYNQIIPGGAVFLRDAIVANA